MKNFDLPIKIEVLIYCVQNNTLLFLALKRSIEDGGFWQPLTGTLEAQDTIETCIFREIEEEIGLYKKDIVSISDPIHHFTWEKKNIGLINEYVFAVEIKNNKKIYLSPEHSDYKWGTKEETRCLYKMNENKIALDNFNI